MPILNATYKAPTWIGGKHAQTILPSLFRKVTGIDYTRERIATHDGDFLDIDWSRVGSKKLLIVAHGLEGSSRQPYVKGMCKEFNARGWDALGWNFRSCSGELNHTARLYHGGCTDDLEAVVNHACKTKKYKTVCLLGFSLGGNITLKYLADCKATHPKQLRKAVAISAPCDLYACARNLSTGINRVYLNRFLETLRAKMQKKAEINPGLYSGINFENIQNFIEFDNRVTAPLCGFRDAIHYYLECSSKYCIKDIEHPTLILNALNDPFMHPSCYPIEQCSASSNVYFEGPYDGGHLGFVNDHIMGVYWSELRAAEFLED